MAKWQISGEYMETCNCAFLCPCITSNLTARPTEGDCKFAVAMRIDKGEKDGVKLNKWKTVEVDKASLATSREGVFAGGDCDGRHGGQQPVGAERRHQRGDRVRICARQLRRDLDSGEIDLRQRKEVALPAAESSSTSAGATRCRSLPPSSFSPRC